MAPMPTLLIDGHNLLYATWALFGAHWEDEHPRRAAREALIAWLLSRLEGEGLDTALYFDGPAANVAARSPSLAVVYSGGEGAQRADAAILRHLARLSADAQAAPVTVVTRDLKLARRARKRGAVVVDPVAFCTGLGGLPPDAAAATGTSVSVTRSTPVPPPPAAPE